MNIIAGGLDDPRVQALLAYHYQTASAQTAPGSAHALDLSGLRSADIQFWSAWEGEQAVGTGALMRLSATDGEVKSMHTDSAYRRQGVGSALLRTIIAAAGELGLSRLWLETGSAAYFAAARQMYRRHGFVEGPPFGSYVPDPNSVFMRLEIESA